MWQQNISPSKAFKQTTLNSFYGTNLNSSGNFSQERVQPNSHFSKLIRGGEAFIRSDDSALNSRQQQHQEVKQQQQNREGQHQNQSEIQWMSSREGYLIEQQRQQSKERFRPSIIEDSQQPNMEGQRQFSKEGYKGGQRLTGQWQSQNQEQWQSSKEGHVQFQKEQQYNNQNETIQMQQIQKKQFQSLPNMSTNLQQTIQKPVMSYYPQNGVKNNYPKAMSVLDLLTSTKTSNKSIVNSLIDQSHPFGFKSNFSRHGQGEHDDIEDINLRAPFRFDRGYVGQGRVEEDIDEEDCVEIVGIPTKTNESSIRSLIEAGSNVQRHIFAPKYDSQLETSQQRSSQEAFNFLSNNSQTKSSQDILNELEIKQFIEKKAQERQRQEKQNQLLDKQNNKDGGDVEIKVQSRFQIDPSSLAQQRQKRADDLLNSYKYIKDPKQSSLQVLQQVSNTQKNPQRNANQVIIDKFSKRQEEELHFEGNDSGEEDDEDSQSGQSEGDKEKKKKRRLNDGRASELAGIKYYHEKVAERLAKNEKKRQKEEEKNEKMRQELIEKMKMEHAQKEQETRKVQREKLVKMKKMEEMRKGKKIENQNTMEYRVTMKKMLKDLNVDETFAQNAYEKQIVAVPNPSGAPIITLKQDSTINEQALDFEFLFDEIESEEDRKNYYSLLRFIFSQEFNKEGIDRVENKQIPMKYLYL